MANELVHATVGTTMTQAEFEAVGLHVCNSQATGDLIYASSATQLSRLAIGAADTVLTCNGTIPAWSATPILNTAVAKGTWTASGTWTIPAVTLGGTVTLNSKLFSGTLNMYGTLPSPIASNVRALFPTFSLYDDGAANVYLGENTYYNDTNNVAIITGAALRFAIEAGALNIQTAPSVSAGATQTFTTRLGVGNTGTIAFGTYSAGVATESTGYITVNDAGGTPRKLMVQA